MGLDDLPVHRREALLWHYALDLDYDGVNDLVRESAGGSCRWQRRAGAASPETTAVLGDDGRYHLLVNRRLQCAGRSQRRDPIGTFRHDQWCHWWTDGTRYRVQAPPDAWGPTGPVYGEHCSLDITWLVTLTDVRTDPALVPTRCRCVDPSVRAEWPGYQGPTTPLGRQRAQLAAALGAHCHACRSRPGAFVDHDHFTGLVRGLLCGHCNTHIDKCPHVSGCPWADYLNNPPLPTCGSSTRNRTGRPQQPGRREDRVSRVRPALRGPAAVREWPRPVPPGRDARGRAVTRAHNPQALATFQNRRAAARLRPVQGPARRRAVLPAGRHRPRGAGLGEAAPRVLHARMRRPAADHGVAHRQA